jgi:hypothetical protein
MTKTSILVPALTGLLLLTSACSGQPGTPAGSGRSTVLFTGDSVAQDEAIALTAALRGGTVDFRSIAADGGGNVVRPFSDQNWPKLAQQIAATEPTVVVYQITTYDWGTQPEQQAAYRRLLTTVTSAGARLAFVTMPPIRPDDFYTPHMADLNRTAAVARAVALGSSGRATVLDAGAVWGTSYQQTRNSRADRSTDGIHPCPQGAARFTSWLLGELATLLPGFSPADPRTWANSGWATDRRFLGC